jgi:hypothetical protein
MTSLIQTLKPAMDSRVRIDMTQRLGSQRQNQGEGLTCPAGAGDINYDIYGRLVTQNTLNLNDAACSNYTGITAATYLQYENNVRPSIPICSAGMRGAGDTGGYSKHFIPRKLYGPQSRGGFVRFYGTPNNIPPNVVPDARVKHRTVQEFDFSHDSSSNYIRG